MLALQNGEVFGYENMSSGGMGQVQANMAKLPQADVEAIAEYLISLNKVIVLQPMQQDIAGFLRCFQAGKMPAL